MSKVLKSVTHSHAVSSAEKDAIEKLDAYNKAKAEWLEARDLLIKSMVGVGLGRQIKSTHFRLSEHKVNPVLDSTKLCAALRVNYVELYKRFGKLNKTRTVLTRILSK